MFRSNDDGYALFRETARNHYSEMIVRLVAHKRLLKSTREWLNTWMNDAPDGVGDLVSDVYHALERESGYKFKV